MCVRRYMGSTPSSKDCSPSRRLDEIGRCEWICEIKWIQIHKRQIPGNSTTSSRVLTSDTRDWWLKSAPLHTTKLHVRMTRQATCRPCRAWRLAFMPQGVSSGTACRKTRAAISIWIEIVYPRSISVLHEKITESWNHTQSCDLFQHVQIIQWALNFYSSSHITSVYSNTVSNLIEGLLAEEARLRKDTKDVARPGHSAIELYMQTSFSYILIDMVLSKSTQINANYRKKFCLGLQRSYVMQLSQIRQNNITVNNNDDDNNDNNSWDGINTERNCTRYSYSGAARGVTRTAALSRSNFLKQTQET